MTYHLQDYDSFTKNMPIDPEVFEDLFSALQDLALTEQLHACNLISNDIADEFTRNLETEIMDYYTELCRNFIDEIVMDHFIVLYDSIKIERDTKWKSAM